MLPYTYQHLPAVGPWTEVPTTICHIPVALHDLEKALVPTPSRSGMHWDWDTAVLFSHFVLCLYGLLHFPEPVSPLTLWGRYHLSFYFLVVKHTMTWGTED